jgi:hypothetical protein
MKRSGAGEAGPQRDKSSALAMRWENESGGLKITFLRPKLTASERT